MNWTEFTTQQKARRDAVSIALICLALVPFVAPVLVGTESFFYKDCQIWLYPLRLYLREHLLAGDLPLWAPELGVGLPFLAGPGNGVFYPLNLILLLPAPACVGQFLVAHLFLATWGTFALARQLTLGRPAAAAAALIYGLSGYLLSMTAHSGLYALSLAWMPVVLALGRRAARRRKLPDTAWFALALGTQVLTGEYQGCLFTGVLALAFTLAESDRRLASLAWLAGGAAGALTLAAPQLLPTLSMLPDSARASGLTFAEAAEFSMHPLRLAEWLVAGIYGDSIHATRWLGGFMVDKPYRCSPWFASAYCGSLAVVLAAAVWLRRRGRHPRWAVATALVGLACLVLALGRHTPLYEWFLAVVPPARFFRYPAKFVGLATFCLALVAAYGLDSWLARLEQGVAGRGTALVWGGLSAAVLALAACAPWIAGALAGRDPLIEVSSATAIIRSACLLEGSLLAGFGLAAALLARRRPRWLAMTVPAMLLAQLALMNHGIPITVDSAFYTEEPLLARRVKEGTPEGEPVRLYVQSRSRPVHTPCLTTADPREDALWRQTTLYPNTGLIHGVGYNNAYIATRPPEVFDFWHETHDIRPELLDLLSVRHAVYSADYEGLKKHTHQRILTSKYPCLTIAEGVKTFPVARPVPGVVATSDFYDALGQIKMPAVLRGEVALVEGAEATRPAPRGEELGECRSRRQLGEVFETRCDLTRPSWVVVNIGYHPRLRATVDGEATELHRANGIVTALRVPAGAHEIAIAYTEPLLRPGLIASLVMLFVIATAVTRRWWA